MGDINRLLNPKTIAIVGASRDEKKIGHVIFKNLLKSGKKIFPVNPKAREILGHKVYEDLLEIPHGIDLVIIAVPAKIVPLILRHAQKRKIKSALIISSGFSETGNTELEERVKKIAEEAEITLLGPNSYGFINPFQKLNTTYYQEIPKPCKIAFISQSGAIGSAVLDNQQKLSGFVSIGNSLQLDFSDFIEYYSKDQNTKVITLYIESLKKEKGKRFLEVCKKCKKPILALKSGKSERGQKAAKSHTAALASEKGVYSGIFKQAGIIEVDSIRQLFKLAEILEKYPGQKFRKAGIITNAGGVGVLTTDACEENKIKVPSLSKKATEKLDKLLSPNWSHNNPVDIVGDALAEDYKKAIQVLEKEDFDFLITLLTPQIMTEPLKTAKILTKSKKPILACFLGKRQVGRARKFLNRSEIINFTDVKEMCDTLGKLR